MPIMEKKKLINFAKRITQPPQVADILAKKRAQAKKMGEAPMPSAASVFGMKKPEMGEGSEEEGSEKYLHEMVEEAAEEAEAGKDTDLEDAIAGTQSKGPEDVPAWATDAAKWREAAEAVGLGGAADGLYAEPFVVAAYLYKRLGGPIKGVELEPPPVAPEEADAETDMKKPGAAAKAIQAQRALHGSGNDALQKLVEEAATQAKTNPDPEIARVLADYDPERDGNPASWVADETKWERAKKAVEPYWDNYETPYAVVAHVYKNMGGKIKGKEK